MEGIDEASSFATELLLSIDEGANLGDEAFVGSSAGSLHFLDLGIHPAKGLTHGAKEFVDGLLPLREIAGGAFVKLAELGAREIEE